MSDKPKVLLAVGERALERTLTTELCDEFTFVREASYREIVIQRIKDEQPDIILIREALKGSMPIDKLILDIRQSFPSIRIIFYTRKYRPGEPLLRRLVSYGVYDFIGGESVKKQQLFDGLRQEKQLSDVRQYLDAVDIQTNSPQMHVTTEYQDLSEPEPASPHYPEPSRPKKPAPKEKKGKEKGAKAPQKKKNKAPQAKKAKKAKTDNKKGFLGKMLPFGSNKSSAEEPVELDLSNEDAASLNRRPEEFKLSVDDASKEEVAFWGEPGVTEKPVIPEPQSTPAPKTRNPLPMFHQDMGNEARQSPTEQPGQQRAEEAALTPKPEPKPEPVAEPREESTPVKSSPIVAQSLEEEEEDLFGTVVERRTSQPKRPERPVQVGTTEPVKEPTPATTPPKPEQVRAEPQKVRAEPTLEIPTRGKPNAPHDDLALHRKETAQEPELDFNPLEVDGPKPADITPVPQHSKPTSVPTEPIEHNEVRSEGWSGRQNKGAIKVSNKQVVTFVGATHGVGNTHVAFNSAVQLAEEGNKVLYMECHSVFSSIDFSLQMGTWQQGIEKALEDIEHNGGMSAGEHILRIKDIKQNARKDKALRKLYKPLPDTLDYMFYSQDYQTLEEQHPVPKERLKDLVMYLLTRENYDVIVVDSEPIGERGVDGLLNISSKVYITMTQDPAQMGVFHRQFDATQKRIKITDQRYIVVNQFVKTEPTVNRINKWTNEKVLQTVPFTHKDVVTANYLGVPFILKTKHQSAINAFDSLIEHIAD